MEQASDRFVSDGAGVLSFSDKFDYPTSVLIAPFGFDDPRVTRFHRDPTGWPLAIGPGWFRAPDGSMRAPPTAELELIAATVAKPDSIRLVWVKTEDGSEQLVRRYLASPRGVDTLVDIAAIGWIYRTAFADELDPELLAVGELAWPQRH